MDSSSRVKFVSDLVKHSFVHPYNGVALIVRRKPNGDRYITCKSVNNRALFISEELLNQTFDAIDTWISIKYASSDPTNSWGLSICGGEPGEANRLTITFSLHDNIPTIDLRNWWRSDKFGVFSPTPMGFTIRGPENIEVFAKMRHQLRTYSEELDKLDKHINFAHQILFEMYDEVCGKPYNNQITSVIQTIDIEKFISIWRERAKTINGFDSDISPCELCTYILSEGIESLERYIECTQFMRDPYAEA